ncbi:hypothetical protein RBU49_16490 [Clostridium sp. MB40-C1]|uniref:tetratricopeptide repeat protein n=1 Tax=Clostridium sp. MB40-C1 TaxID=3070996 RepID=UPI0027DFB22E|nr:hypothetical protein [Clostridium sp. MB40-C1]WMJ80380.1 hypothetical protein RBU49_16490 [Clostridium sp. MB40-C1]
MLKRFSLKTKLIIFIIISIISICIIIKEGINNRKANSITNKKIEIKSSSNEEVKLQNKSKDTEIIKDKGNLYLEEKYKKGYDTFHRGNYEEAIKIVDEVIAKDKNFYKAYSIKGIALCFLGNYEEGMKFINKCLQINPQYGYGRFNKALGYELYGHYDEALRWYDKALEVERYIWSYYGKASIYGRRGDINNTVKYLKIAINMDSSVKKIAEEERDFNNVRKFKEFKELVK